MRAQGRGQVFPGRCLVARGEDAHVFFFLPPQSLSAPGSVDSCSNACCHLHAAGLHASLPAGVVLFGRECSSFLRPSFVEYRWSLCVWGEGVGRRARRWRRGNHTSPGTVLTLLDGEGLALLSASRRFAPEPERSVCAPGGRGGAWAMLEMDLLTGSWAAPYPLTFWRGWALSQPCKCD